MSDIVKSEIEQKNEEKQLSKEEIKELYDDLMAYYENNKHKKGINKLPFPKLSDDGVLELAPAGKLKFRK